MRAGFAKATITEFLDGMGKFTLAEPDNAPEPENSFMNKRKKNIIYNFIEGCI
jgi:hypothetical protein